jgi:hypothetical protein
MAVIYDLMTSYDQSTTNLTWYAPGVHMISPADTPLQLLLPKIQVLSTDPSWDEDTLTSQVSAVAATVTAVAVTLFVTGASSRIPTDVTTFNVPILIDNEYMLVTAISGTTTLTVTRGHASSTTATHNLNAEVHILAPELLENDNAQASFVQGRTKNYNYIQEFEKIVEVTNIQEAVQKVGGINSELQYDIDKAKREIALQLEIATLLNPARAAGSKSTKKSMGGLLGTISTHKTADSGSIDEAAIQEDFRLIKNSGGTPRVIIASTKLAQDMANIYKTRIRTDVVNTIGGVFINTIVDPLAPGPIPIIPHMLMPVGTYMVLDTARLALLWLIPFQEEPLAKTKRASKRMVSGAYSLMIANEEAHAVRYGFS